MQKENEKFLEEGKRKLRVRDSFVLGESLWNSIRPDILGLSENAYLAGPGTLVYKGPGGYFKVVPGKMVTIDPITNEEMEEFKKSFS